jgi:hypothetical protein
MKTILMACLCSAAGAVSVWWTQDPVKPAPAPEQAPADAPKGMPAPSPLEGVFELRVRTRDGTPEAKPGRGYLVITKRHLTMCLIAPGSDADHPLVRAGVRSWKKQVELVNTEIKIGFYGDLNGDIHVEEQGKLEPRRIELARGRLRVWQDERDYLEFERIE